jgi:hypothetical protein
MKVWEMQRGLGGAKHNVWVLPGGLRGLGHNMWVLPHGLGVLWTGQVRHHGGEVLAWVLGLWGEGG